MTRDWRHLFIAGCLEAVTRTGAARWLAPWTRGAGAILMLHHVRPARPEPFQPNAILEITPTFLDRAITLVRRLGFEIVPLDAVPDRLAHPREKPFVALTFDDGYRDNVEHALPVLRRHGAPWTVFAVADYASGRGQLWWIELEEAVRRLDRVRLVIDGTERELPAGSVAEKRAAFATAYRHLRAGPEPHLRRVIAGWAAEAGIDSAALVRSLCLDWEELRRLSREPGVTIGAHTLSHPMLAKHDEATARREILDSQASIAEELGLAVAHFAYPVGDPTSAGPREFAIARQAGFSTAVTTRPGHVFADHAAHPTALPRVSVNGLHQSERALSALLSGLPFAAHNRGRRLNVA